eukprot:Pompholyxophrys_punicea_v1_NODE_284_length_2390_cov_13.907066.p1 type:complete len:298 gc:universal NODE_284_length_2390_cov_13.907066:807-1700(+)
MNQNFGEFNPKTESWLSYSGRLKEFIIASGYDLTKEKRRIVAVLLSSIGPDTYNLLQNLCEPENPKHFNRHDKLQPSNKTVKYTTALVMSPSLVLTHSFPAPPTTPATFLLPFLYLHSISFPLPPSPLPPSPHSSPLPAAHTLGYLHSPSSHPHPFCLPTLPSFILKLFIQFLLYQPSYSSKSLLLSTRPLHLYPLCLNSSSHPTLCTSTTPTNPHPPFSALSTNSTNLSPVIPPTFTILNFNFSSPSSIRLSSLSQILFPSCPATFSSMSNYTIPLSPAHLIGPTCLYTTLLPLLL